MILFSLIVPFFARYGVNEYDLVYANVLPKVASFEGSGFWDGTKRRDDASLLSEGVLPPGWGHFAA